MLVAVRPEVSIHIPENLLRLLEEMKPKKELFLCSVKTGDRILLIPLTEICTF